MGAEGNKFKVNPTGSFQADLVQYINDGLFKSDMSDFLDFKKKNFGEDTLNEISEIESSSFADAVKDSLDRMGGTLGDKTDFETSQFHNWLQGSVGTIMFLNVRSAGLQTLSIMNYMSPSNAGTFAKDFIKAGNKGTDQYKTYQTLWNTPYMKERRARAGFDVNAEEIARKFEGREGKFAEATKWALNKGFVLTSLADSFAIAKGGAAYVHGLTKNGMSEKEAIQKWIEKSEEAQQSARPDRVSKHQKASISKFVLAFANTPQQYFRLSQKAHRNMQDMGGITKALQTKEGRTEARKILYYVAAQNVLFTSLQAMSGALFTGWGGDDDEQKEAIGMVNSMLDTVLRGMGLYGAVASSIKNVGLNLYNEKDKANPDFGKAALKGGLTISPPISRKANDLLQIGNAYKYDKGEVGVRSAHAQAISKGLSLANIPADWLQKKLSAVQRLIELGVNPETAWETLQMIGGYSEYSVTKGKNKDNLDFNFDFDGDFDFEEDFDFDF